MPLVQIASDLHLERYRGGLPGTAAFTAHPRRDLLVLAGDIGVGLGALRFIQRETALSPVVYVLGNHEFYGIGNLHDALEARWRQVQARTPGLHVLSSEKVEVAGVSVYGAPWYSGPWPNDPIDDTIAYWRLVQRGINDFVPPNDDIGQWSVGRHIDRHQAETEAMERNAHDVDVVVTHWPPVREAISPAFRKGATTQRALNRYFVNDREDLVRRLAPQWWIAGHVHTPFRTRIGPTTIVGNPAGYRSEPKHPTFERSCVVRVDSSQRRASASLCTRPTS